MGRGRAVTTGLPIRPWRVVFLLAVLSLLLTWPLLPNLLTHVPGDGIDDPALAWNLWWAKHSWVDQAGIEGLVHNPFDGDSMFYPVSINLAFYTLTLLNGALSIPLQVAGSVILANNLLLLSSFVIGGLGAYLLALEVLAAGTRKGRQELAAVALLAGLFYAFASTKLFYVSLGQFNIASSQWLPFVALYVVRSLRPPFRWRNGLMLGLFLCFQTWAELTYGSFGALLIALVVALTGIVALLRPAARPAFIRLLACSALAGVLFVAGLAPYLLNMAPDLAAESDFLVEGGGFADVFSADLVGFFLPTQLHPLFGSLIRAIAGDSAIQPDGTQFQVNKGQHLFFGYTVLVLAVVGLWANRKRLWVWGLAALTAFFLLVSLGPNLRIGGFDTGIPGVFPLLLKIPFFQANRYPSRYSILILLGLGLLACLGAAALLSRIRPARRLPILLLLAGLILFEHLSIPLPLSDFRLPPAYAAVVADARPGAVLDLPVGWRNGFNVFGKSDVVIMFEQWYQSNHGKALLGGNTSRNPEHKFQYFLENPVIGVLAAIQDGRPVADEDLRLAQQLAPDLLRFLAVHTVLVHRDKVPADFEQQISQLFPLDLVEEQDGISRYEARWPAERQQVNLAADDPELPTYLRQGWGPVSAYEGRPVRWATRSQPKLLLPGLSRPAEIHLALVSPGPQRLMFWLDDEFLAEQDLQPGLNSLVLTAPAAPDGMPRRLDIQADRTFTPAELPPAPRSIGGTGVVSPVDIVVRSAGKDTGDFGHIYVAGVDHSPNQRGYNLVAIEPATGQVLDAAVFDTHDPFLAPQPSADLAAWVAALPAGAIVAGAVRDAAALSLGEDAARALGSLGVQTDIRGSLRRAHAFVGEKGAAAASAVDVHADAWPATVVVGNGLTEANPTFALVEMGWMAVP